MSKSINFSNPGATLEATNRALPREISRLKTASKNDYIADVMSIQQSDQKSLSS